MARKFGNIKAREQVYGDVNTHQIEKLGKMISESYSQKYLERNVKSPKEFEKVERFIETFAPEMVGERLTAEEDFNTVKEDLLYDANDGTLYTNVVADFIEQRMRPTLLARGLIKEVSIDATGTSSYDIPINNIFTAQPLPNSESVTDNSQTYGTVAVDLAWQHASVEIGHKTKTQSNVDIIADQLGLIGYAIARKVDSDIITAFEQATPNTNANSNYLAFGTSNNLTYTRLLQLMTNAMGNDANPDFALMGPGSLFNLMSDSNTITALGYNSQEKGSIFPRTIEFLGMQVVVSNQVSEKDVFVGDSEQLGYMVNGSGVEVMDGRVSRKTTTEYIGLKLYGVKVAQPKALYRGVENTA